MIRKGGEELPERMRRQREELLEEQRKRGIFIPRTAEDVLSVVLEQSENPPPVVPTGMSSLDRILDGGLRPTEVFVIASRPRVGKTALTLQFAINAARNGHVVYIWTREMSEEAYMRRAVAAGAVVNNRNIRTGNITAEEWTRIYAAAGSIAQLPIYFAVGRPDILTVVDEMRSMCDNMEHSKLPLVVIDYLQLLEPPQADSREQEIAYMSRALKGAAKDYGLAMLLVAQLSRKAENRIPRLEDLRESGQIEADADIVGLLHRDTEEKSPILTPRGALYVSKNRDGEEGAIQLWYEGKHFKFTERLPDED